MSSSKRLPTPVVGFGNSVQPIALTSHSELLLSALSDRALTVFTAPHDTDAHPTTTRCTPQQYYSDSYCILHTLTPELSVAHCQPETCIAHSWLPVSTPHALLLLLTSQRMLLYQYTLPSLSSGPLDCTQNDNKDAFKLLWYTRMYYSPRCLAISTNSTSQHDSNTNSRAALLAVGTGNGCFVFHLCAQQNTCEGTPLTTLAVTVTPFAHLQPRQPICTLAFDGTRYLAVAQLDNTLVIYALHSEGIAAAAATAGDSDTSLPVSIDLLTVSFPSSSDSLLSDCTHTVSGKRICSLHFSPQAVSKYPRL